jgi:hypothetical protein
VVRLDETWLRVASPCQNGATDMASATTGNPRFIVLRNWSLRATRGRRTMCKSCRRAKRAPWYGRAQNRVPVSAGPGFESVGYGLRATSRSRALEKRDRKPGFAFGAVLARRAAHSRRLGSGWTVSVRGLASGCHHGAWPWPRDRVEAQIPNRLDSGVAGLHWSRQMAAGATARGTSWRP